MTTCDDRFPIGQTERPLRFESGETNPAVLVHGELTRLFGEHRSATDRLLASVAQAYYQIGRVRSDLEQSGCGEAATPAIDALEIIAANLADPLEAHHVRVEDLTDRPWSTEMCDAVDVRGHAIREDLDEPRIAHMELPVVYRDERVIARGAVIVETPKRQ